MSRSGPALLFAACAGLPGLTGCSPEKPPSSQSESPSTKSDPRPLEQVQAAHEGAWLALPNVIGTGIAECDGRPCLNVFVSAPHAAHSGIPDTLEGYAVKIIAVGPVKALDK